MQIDVKEELRKLAKFNAGEYTETWRGEGGEYGGQKIFTAELKTPKAIFRRDRTTYSCEPEWATEDKARYELLWFLLQKAVEFVNEQHDIAKMFNPDPI